MTEAMKEKRKKLQALSLLAKALVERGRVESINEGLKFLYKSDGHEDLKTFKQWKESGQTVKKGEKGLMLWAKPLHVLREEPKEEGENSYFPVMYVFSKKQVEPIKTLAA
ncbi:MAG: ArdC-like ssDNA-binding domain-containing protein [Bacteroidetes bacterium]|nr:ArdC-like ssDNA-binding domain-containing protein [Bacteroidota bacterium]